MRTRKEEQQRISFDQSNLDTDNLTPSKSTKLDSSKSIFSQKKAQRVDFENQAREINNQKQTYLSNAYELGLEFKERFVDSTVPSQSGPLSKSKDNEIIEKLINFAITVNNDENEDEGMGSVAILTLMLNLLLKLRDRCNVIEYKYFQLENYCTKLEEKLRNEPKK